MEICRRCDENECEGSVSGLCSRCWWIIASWSSCRKDLSAAQLGRLLEEKNYYGVKD